MKTARIRSGPSAIPAAANTASTGLGSSSTARSMESWSRQVHLDGLVGFVVHRRVVHDGHRCPEVSHYLGRGRAHAGCTADHQRVLAVVPELLDASH